jgi:hypothetical protein
MKKTHLTPLYLTILLLTFSCTEEKIYNQEVCNDLSMKYFRGLPKPSKDFKDNCSKFKIEYDQKKCQSALQAMMLGSREESLKKKFGDKIMGCFNRGDIQKFLKN